MRHYLLRSRLPVILVAAAATLSLTMSPVTAASAMQPTSQTLGWVHFSTSSIPLTLNNVTTETFQGTRAPDGLCHGTLTLSHAPGTPAIGVIEVAANPATCQQMVEIGDLANVQSVGSNVD